MLGVKVCRSFIEGSSASLLQRLLVDYCDHENLFIFDRDVSIERDCIKCCISDSFLTVMTTPFLLRDSTIMEYNDHLVARPSTAILECRRSSYLISV